MSTAVFESPLGLVRITGDDAGVALISCTDSSVNNVIETQFEDQL